VVQIDHRSSVGLSTSVQLFEPRWGVSSDVTSTLLGAGVLHVDTMPPLVYFNATAGCSPENDTVTATVNQTLCVSWGTLAAEPLGCAIWLTFNS
jgi:hypothetical protein